MGALVPLPPALKRKGSAAASIAGGNQVSLGTNICWFCDMRTGRTRLKCKSSTTFLVVEKSMAADALSITRKRHSRGAIALTTDIPPSTRPRRNGLS